MAITVTGFANSPDGGRALARDMRVRWALEELGLAHERKLLSRVETKAPDYRALNPFGQVPVYEDGTVSMWESGAIVLHLAQSHPGLLPQAPQARGRALSWVFASLSTVEPVIHERGTVVMLESDKPWSAERLALIDTRLRVRLGELAQALGDKPWLEGDFTAGDLMMVTVLRRLSATGLLAEVPALADYVSRGEARPAFQRAFAAQVQA